MSQEEKEALPKGVVVVDSQPNILATAVQLINCHMEDVVTRYITTSAQCISTSLLPCTFSRSHVAEFFVAL